MVHRLDRVIVLTDYDAALAGRWHRLLLRDGRNGYVVDGDARRPIDLRAFFARTPAGWQMVICIAGD